MEVVNTGALNHDYATHLGDVTCLAYIKVDDRDVVKHDYVVGFVNVDSLDLNLGIHLLEWVAT